MERELQKQFLQKTKLVVEEEKKEEETKTKKIKPIKNSSDEIMQLGFTQIGKSQVTLWHRPGVGDLKLLQKLQNITLIITLLSMKENPQSILKECKNLGIENYHIEINGANAALLSDKKTIKTIRASLTEIYKILSLEEHRVLIHCAAGIHRTGTLSYSLMRIDGRTPQQAWEGLLLMRKATHEGVGDWRIQLAEKLILPDLIQTE